MVAEFITAIQPAIVLLAKGALALFSGLVCASIILPGLFVPLLQIICRPLFGRFEREELLKFLRMGLVFACIIGAYWSLRTMKNSLFTTLAGSSGIPYAKTLSLLCMFVFIAGYTWLLDRYPREKVFYLLSGLYGGLAILFGVGLVFIEAPKAVIAARSLFPWAITQVFAYFFYVFIESYGSLVVALFWAITTDVTSPESAKKGFSLVVALGQIGGIFAPTYINSLPIYFGHTTSGAAVAFDGVIMVLASVFLLYLMKFTPADIMKSFHGKNEAQKEHEQEPGFMEGFWLLLNNKYLLGIFAVIFSFEAIVTIFDFNFNFLVDQQYHGLAKHAYMGEYGSWVNIIALACLLLGVNNITRVLGVGVALAMMPVIVGGAIGGFVAFHNLQYLFWIMVFSKAINYALMGPALKQLYIPTTHDVRFKAQAWIETFGSRGSKEAGSIVNMTDGAFQWGFGTVAGHNYYVLMSACLGLGVVGAWFLVALFLGRTYRRAIETNTVVC